jgi:hypothetical protein
MTTITPVNLQSLTLAQDFEPGDTTFRVIGRFEKTSLPVETRYLIGPQLICFSPFTSNSELIYVDIIADPTLVTGTTNTYEYPVTTRGLDTDNIAVPPTKYSASNEKTHRGQQSKVAIVIDGAIIAGLQSALEANVANRFAQFFCFDAATDVSVGDGRQYFQVPAKFDATNLIIANATVLTAGVTGDMTIQIHNVTSGADMLSTPITIASAETTGSGVIDLAEDDISTGDILRIDIDTVAGTPAKGLIVNLEFEN